MNLLGSDLVRQTLATETIRAVETYRPESVRLYDDSVGVHLLPPVWQAFVRPMRFSLLRRPTLWYRERQFPGVIGNMACRTRFIDDVVERELRDGIDKVVILGAGFDARAYRIPGMEAVDVFEVDHPKPQAVKRARVRSAFGSVPSHLTFVPVDFEVDDLRSSLEEAGYDAEGRTPSDVDARTLFVWEGVTQYLTEEAVDSTLRAISSLADGGTLVFTYVERDVIEGSGRTADDAIAEFAASQGTPWIFGLDRDEVGAFLAERGLTLEEDVGAAEYRERYLDPVGRGTSVFEGERAVVAGIGGG